MKYLNAAPGYILPFFRNSLQICLAGLKISSNKQIDRQTNTFKTISLCSVALINIFLILTKMFYALTDKLILLFYYDCRYALTDVHNL